ncbi:cell division protein FtsB [Luteimonas sp. FXH3W]|uniref:Cell division protein FtsB n=1 Tax=Aquilutibacter rugosus TaxID=3115820 RepID=A0ABU7UZ61_9GAMM
MARRELPFKLSPTLILIGILALLLLLMQYSLWLGDHGETAVIQLRRVVAQQQHENEGLRQRNSSLAAEVEDLKSGEGAVEERARNELGMIKPGETFYRVVPAGAMRQAQAAQQAAAAAGPPAPVEPADPH